MFAHRRDIAKISMTTWTQILDQYDNLAHSGGPTPGQVQIWAARTRDNVSSSCGSTQWWASAKADVIKFYATSEGVRKVNFYDDTQENIDAVNALALELGTAKVYAQQVSKPSSRDDKQSGWLVQNPSVHMRDDLEAQARRAGRRNSIAVFDFDYTLSDVHSSGKMLTVKDGVPYCQDSARHSARPCFNDIQTKTDVTTSSTYAWLHSIATHYKSFVVLSRGVLEDLVHAFSALGFQVVAHEIQCPQSPTNPSVTLKSA